MLWTGIEDLDAANETHLRRRCWKGVNEMHEWEWAKEHLSETANDMDCGWWMMMGGVAFDFRGAR